MFTKRELIERLFPQLQGNDEMAIRVFNNINSWPLEQLKQAIKKRCGCDVIELGYNFFQLK